MGIGGGLRGMSGEEGLCNLLLGVVSEDRVEIGQCGTLNR